MDRVEKYIISELKMNPFVDFSPEEMKRIFGEVKFGSSQYWEKAIEFRQKGLNQELVGCVPYDTLETLESMINRFYGDIEPDAREIFLFAKDKPEIIKMMREVGICSYNVFFAIAKTAIELYGLNYCDKSWITDTTNNHFLVCTLRFKLQQCLLWNRLNKEETGIIAKLWEQKVEELSFAEIDRAFSFDGRIICKRGLSNIVNKGFIYFPQQKHFHCEFS